MPERGWPIWRCRARKMKAFVKERVAAIATEDEWEAALQRSGDRLLVIEFAASWSEPCKQMAQVLGALARQPDYNHVDFARVDLEACPALGAKKAVLAAPTYHFYRAGELVTSFSGAMPHRLIELLDTHKGAAEAKRGGTKLMALLGILAAGGAALALANSLSSKRAAPAAAPLPPPVHAAEPAAEPAAESEAARELHAPVKKVASSPSAGARLER